MPMRINTHSSSAIHEMSEPVTGPPPGAYVFFRAFCVAQVREAVQMTRTLANAG
jgi:hypothetical protein